MGYDILVPESSVNESHSRAIPSEDELRTYIRLYTQRSIPGQEEVSKARAISDATYDVLPIDTPYARNEFQFESFNWLRTFLTSGHVPMDIGNEGACTTAVAEGEFWGADLSRPIAQYKHLFETGHSRMSWKNSKVNSAYDARSSVAWWVKNSLETFVTRGNNLFLFNLAQNGYVRNMGERALLSEIETRRTQFPSTNLIAFVGNTTYNFLESAYGNRDFIKAELGGYTS